MYDLIGDIHGYADELVELLARLDYRPRNGVYSHPERKVIFLGDFVDRGPKIREVLEIVRGMVLSGQALAVLGNHEWNALAFDTEDPDHPGQHLRRRSTKNTRQHQRTLDQLDDETRRVYWDWFRTLPLWLELDGLRAVHACWDQASIDRIAPVLATERGISSRFLNLAKPPAGPLFDPVEIILKGKEASLPEGSIFCDKDGHERSAVRTRWYLSPDGHTYRTYALQTSAVDCDLNLAPAVIAAAAPYPLSDKPVFVGHYWLEGEHPQLLAPNVACLDYSVAKDGFLCAYRWNGEQTLSNSHFVCGPRSRMS